MSAPSTPIRLRTPLHPRSSDEPHRTATPLELFFDLVFVVAIAQAASSFHHAIAENHVGDAVTNYFFVFFAIWWAWINFTWFASAYDTDDVAYRLVIFVQLIGALILAAGVSTLFNDNNLGVVFIGYVVMRLALVLQWFRVASTNSDRKPAALRYGFSIAAIQVAWCGVYFVQDNFLYSGSLVLIAVELAIPVWAERASPTTWHAGHLAERYGLFTIIVLGESILASTVAIESTAITTVFEADLVGIIAGGLLIVLSMWWIYFARSSEELLTSMWRAFSWGYGHYFVFGSVAAVGAGIAISVDYATDHAEISQLAANLSVTIPVAVYLISVWAIHYRFRAAGLRERLVAPGFALAILLTSWSGVAVLLTGLLLALNVAIEIVFHQHSVESFEAAPASGD